MSYLFSKSILPLLTCYFLIDSVCAQEKPLPNEYYNAGLLAYSKREYKKADSLFTLALRYMPDADTYFNRAACRQKLGNEIGFCEDLAWAIRNGDKEAAKQFCKKCGRIDTTYLSSSGELKNKKVYSYMVLSYQSKVIDEFTVYYDWQGKQMNTLPFMTDTKRTSETSKKENKSNAEPEVFTIVEDMAEFPGGNVAMMKFVKGNLRTPAELINKGLSGAVFVKFIVDEAGKVQDAMVLKGIEGCWECSTEALRIVNSMPAWTPARMTGKAVKCYFNLPIRFKAD
jgi:Gram-negative bacterial TonB protein C-terminal